MKFTRRGFALTSLSASALALSGCTTGSTPAGSSRGATGARGLPADLRPTPNAAYDAWVAGFRERAAARGISAQTLAAAFRGTGFLPGVITRDRNQTEFKRTLEDYLSIAASDERIAKGRAALARHRGTLTALEQKYGVDAEIITAIWGLESFYGERRGNVPVVSATSTLAFEGRRGRYFEAELMAALRIVQSGDIPAARMTGSWAGAMGHTQFMPTAYQSLAVDFTGDGRRDIWSDDPTDALASTANYLAKRGWQRGLRWGGEKGAPGTPSGSTLQPQPGGPVFSITRNFNVIKRYNNSTSYALGVGHLSDRIAGRGPLRASFPPDKYGLTKKNRITLQKRLSAKGFDTGGADGVIGAKTRAAIEAYQARQGLQVTGDPSLALLRHLG